MPFIRLSDNYIDHPKFGVISDGAFRLWHEIMAYCRRHLTDGLIETKAARMLRSYSPKRLRELQTPWMPGRNPLIETVEGFGFKIHDYLQWNMSRDDELAQQELNRHRGAFVRDKGLRQRLRERDRDRCRYCGVEVNWADRKGVTGATYDHVNPRGPMTDDNLVIACRSCNSRKRDRTPEQAGLVLQDPHIDRLGSRSDLDRNLGRIKDSTGQDRSGIRVFREKESEEKPDLGDRARELLERYPVWFARERRGARIALLGGPIQFAEAMKLCEVWDDARLEKLAGLVLTTDDPFISGTDRGWKIFVMKASWADDRLRQWETQNGIQVTA